MRVLFSGSERSPRSGVLETSGGVTYIDDVECAFLARIVNAQSNAPAVPQFLFARVSESCVLGKI